MEGYDNIVKKTLEIVEALNPAIFWLGDPMGRQAERQRSSGSSEHAKNGLLSLFGAASQANSDLDKFRLETVKTVVPAHLSCERWETLFCLRTTRPTWSLLHATAAV